MCSFPLCNPLKDVTLQRFLERVFVYTNIANMKIVYCTDTICRLGGIEVVTLAKANALAELPGNQVWIVVANNKHSSMTCLCKAKVHDLAVHYYENDSKGGYWHALFDYMRKRKIHRQRLEDALNDIQPDVVISTGTSMKFALPKFKLKSNPVLIRELHYSRHYRRETTSGLRGQLMAFAGESYDYHFSIKKYDKIVVLTEADKSGSWATWDKVVAIPNPITHASDNLSAGTEKVAVTAGRLTLSKNYVAMINVWRKVVDRHPDWSLHIWGSGAMQSTLEQHIKSLGLTDRVFLKGFSPTVTDEMAKASLFISTSISEGFSLATLEAMSVGIPTVVYNCPGGISHLVKDGETGYLIPMNDEAAMVDHVCRLIEDKELRHTMGEAALHESKQYRAENIAQRWMQLFEEELKKKRGE